MISRTDPVIRLFLIFNSVCPKNIDFSHLFNNESK